MGVAAAAPILLFLGLPSLPIWIGVPLLVLGLSGTVFWWIRRSRLALPEGKSTDLVKDLRETLVQPLAKLVCAACPWDRMKLQIVDGARQVAKFTADDGWTLALDADAVKALRADRVGPTKRLELEIARELYRAKVHQARTTRGPPSAEETLVEELTVRALELQRFLSYNPSTRRAILALDNRPFLRVAHEQGLQPALAVLVGELLNAKETLGRTTSETFRSLVASLGLGLSVDLVDRLFLATHPVVGASGAEPVEAIFRQEGQELINFLAQRDSLPEHADLLVVFGNNDLEVLEEAAKLYHEGRVPRVLVSGGRGRLSELLFENVKANDRYSRLLKTEDKATLSEAEMMKRVLVALGLPEDVVLTESTSSNTLENAQKSLATWATLGMSPKTVILMQTPLGQRRAGATAARWWPKDVQIINHAAWVPQVADMDDQALKETLETAVGEVNRLEEYAAKGDLQPVDLKDLQALVAVLTEPVAGGASADQPTAAEIELGLAYHLATHPLAGAQEVPSDDARLQAAQDGLSAERFLHVVRETRRGLRDGAYGQVIVGSNIKEMVAGMRTLYERSDDRLQESYADHVRVIRSIEQPDERKHDLPGGLGVVKQIIATAGEDWVTRPVVMVTDGGFKTRFSYKVLSEGYAGLSWLPGGQYENLRETGLINTLAVMRLLPDGLTRFLGWSASDNFVFLGRAAIGGIPLTDTVRLTEKLHDASIVKGAVKVVLLTPGDLETLKAIADSSEPWTVDLIQRTLGEERWAQIAQLIDAEKLTQLGALAVSEEGELLAFLEKESSLGKVVRLYYDFGGSLYKNPFIELPEKRFIARLLNALQAQPAQTPGVGTLDRLPVSYMQSVYASRFVNEADWMTAKPKPAPGDPEIAGEDWDGIKRSVD